MLCTTNLGRSGIQRPESSNTFQLGRWTLDSELIPRLTRVPCLIPGLMGMVNPKHDN